MANKTCPLSFSCCGTTSWIWQLIQSLSLWPLRCARRPSMGWVIQASGKEKLTFITNSTTKSLWTFFFFFSIVFPPKIKECAAEERGKGYLVSCLVDHRTNISEYQCNQYITKMTSIVFSDYRLICGFMDKCKEDINKLHCGSVNTGEKVNQDALWVT